MTPRRLVPACALLVACSSNGAGGTDGGTLPVDGAPGAADAAPGTPDGAPGSADASLPGDVTLPPVNGKVDYQLGGAYTPPTGVTIVSRDRTASPAAGLYNICYVNGFQVQPGEESVWMATSGHPDLILRDSNGQPVVDPDWDEALVDVSTPAKRTAVAAIVGGWIAGCAASGFDAIEIDNLDSYSRSGGRLTQANAIAAMQLFVAAAHAQHLAIAQKNSAELAPQHAQLGTDFAVVEECDRYDECDVFTGAYGEHVIVIEYRKVDFDKGCSAYPNLSIVLRDLNLVTPSQGAYVYEGC